MCSRKEKKPLSDSRPTPAGLLTRRRESGNDSGHSSAESISPNRDSRGQRCSQSSESSGKFSFRGSVSSPVELEAHPKGLPAKSSLQQTSEDLPVFGEEEPPPAEGLLQKRRRSSLSSMGYLGAIFFRTKTSSSSSSRHWSRTLEEDERKDGRPRRAVSLRLPRSRHPKDLDTKLPTVYVDDEELSSGRGRRKSSLRRALSLLSLNSLTKEGFPGASRAPQKPVQKILRHPTRRHTTVRGISGLAIDGRSQATCRGGLHRAQTLVYYPTNTSLRTALGPSYSNAVYT